MECFGAIEYGASAVDEECSKIFVTLFGDAPEETAFARAVLSGSDAEPRREVTT